MTGPAGWRASSWRGGARVAARALVLFPRALRAQWDKPIDWLFHCTALVEAKWGADSQMCADVSRQGGITGGQPQTVRGAGSAEGVSLSSPSLDLTLAIPVERLLQCAMRQTDPSGYMALRQAGHVVDDVLLLDVPAGELRLDGGGDGALELMIRGEGVEIRGTHPGAVALEPGGPDAMHGDIRAATLELSVDGAGSSCEGLMDAAFPLSEVR